MNVQIRLNASLVSIVGTTRLTVTLADGATVSDLLAQLKRDYPAAAPKLEQAVAVLAGQTIGPERRLQAGQEIALLLPVAGG